MDDNKFVISIDPGTGGAIAVFPPGGMDPELWDMPSYVIKTGRKNRTQVDVNALADILRPFSGKKIKTHVQVVLEEASAQSKGVIAVASTNFSYGAIRGVIAALQLPVELVKPNAWKKIMGLTGKSKDAARAKAREIWPGWYGVLNAGDKPNQTGLDRVSDHDRAEALLIGRWWLIGGHVAEKQIPAKETERGAKEMAKKKEVRDADKAAAARKKKTTKKKVAGSVELMMDNQCVAILDPPAGKRKRTKKKTKKK